MSGPDAQLRLVVTEGAASGTQFVVNDALAIGRQAEGPGRLAGDPEISGRHAEIRLLDGAFVITDLGSRNGTIVNGDTVSAPRSLAVGDRIELGATKLVVADVTARSLASPEPAPNLSVRIDIDARTGIGTVRLGDDAEPIPIVHRAGRWEVGGA